MARGSNQPTAQPAPTRAVLSLVARGWTEYAIADAVNASQPTISRVLNGRSCRFAVGTALVALADRVARDAPESMLEAAHA